MKKKNLLLVLALMLSLSFNTEGQNSLIGPTTTNIQVVRSISPDGRYVTGQSATIPRQAFSWDITTGNVITNLGGSFSDLGVRVSEGYSVTSNNRIIGDFADPELLFLFDEFPYFEDVPNPIRSAGYWEDGNWTGLGLGIATGEPTSGESGSHAVCNTEDGNTIGGFCRTQNGTRVHPYSWTYNAGTSSWDGTLWAEPSNLHQGSGIAAMSGDGTIAVGWTTIGGAARTGILWKSTSNYQIFGYGISGDFSDFICLSLNGKYAGYKHNESCGVYDVENDIYYPMPNGFIVNSISNNGWALGAYRNDSETVKGFIWNYELGYVDFDDFVANYASDVILPIALQNALNPTSPNPYVLNAISADGLSMTIWAQNRAFVLKFGAPIVVVPAPKNLAATVDRNLRNKVILTWNAPDTFEETLENYLIYRDDEVIDTVNANILTYTDMNVDAGYKKYSVRAVYENVQSRKSDPANAMIVDNYDIPFFENFITENFITNYWTPVFDKKSSWFVVGQGGVEAQSPGAVLEVRPIQSEQFTTKLISKPLDATKESSVYLTFMVFAWSASSDKLFIDVTTDGVTWNEMSEYTFQNLTDWRYEMLDISSVAAGKLINFRFRMEGLNNSDDTRYYFFDNIGVSSTILEGNAIPLNIIHKENETSLELAWQNPEGLYALTYQQTPLRYSFGNEGKNIIAAQSFDSKELAIYKEQYLTSISTYVNQKINDPSIPITLKLAVFVDGVRVVSQDVTDFTPNAWNTFALSTPLLLSSVSNNLKIGIEVVTHDAGEIPLGADDAERAVAGKGDLYSEDGGTTWKLLSDESYANYRRNWCIIGNVATEPNTIIRTADILGYNVYLDNKIISDYLIFGQNITTDKVEGKYTVRAYSLTTGISEASEPFEFKIENTIKNIPLSNVLVYSNQNTVYIKNKSDVAIKAVEIFDIRGRAICTRAINNTDTSISLNVSNGIYIVRVISQDNAISVAKVNINN
jgi:hypothetical protein